MYAFYNRPGYKSISVLRMCEIYPINNILTIICVFSEVSPIYVSRELTLCRVYFSALPQY